MEAGDDFELWIEGAVSGPLTETVDLSVREEFRITDELEVHNTDVGVGRRFGDSWSVSLNFREEFERQGDGDFLAEHRPHANVTYAWTWAGFDLSDRNRFELRLREERSDLFRYRNRFQVVAPWSLPIVEVRPYVSEEAFFDSSDGDWNQNRWITGVVRPFGERASGSVYHMLRSVDRDGWDHIHVLGFAGSLSF